jgi:hypothetical protein
LEALSKKQGAEPFEVSYQRWYSRALPLMKQLAPDRSAEFQAFYCREWRLPESRRWDFVIRDYFVGKEAASYEARKEAARCFNSQLAILKSVTDRIEWMSLDTEEQAGRGLLLAQLEAARDLIKISERAAGAVAGVVLESYLKQLAQKRQLKSKKRAPTSAELVEALKEAKAFDVPVWSQATWLAEIHSRCRSEGEGPTKLQVRDLVDGTQWLLTNVF